MRVRLVVSLLSAFIAATAGVGVNSVLPAAAGFRSPAPAKPNNAAELLSPKLRAVLRAGPGQATTAAMPQLAASVPCNGWNAVASPDATGNRNVIAGMSAVGLNDIWAVGTYVNNGGVYQTLAMHWDGTVWSLIPSPSVGGGNNLLTSVTAIAPADVWALGYWRPGDSTTYAQPLTEHWNGNSWSVVGAPEVANSSTELFAVNADSSADVWGVGISLNYPVDITGPRGRAFAIHWTGSSWSIVPTANLVAPIAGPGVDVSELNGVKVLAPNDAWAVGDGQDYTGNTPASVDMAFIEHWDGNTWNQVAAPVHQSGDFLSDVQGIHGDMWAVGGQGQNGSSTSDNVLTEHWNGLNWTEVPGQTPGLSANLFALGYINSTTVYAAGASAYTSPGTSQEQDNTLVEQWNGTGWSQLASVNPTSSQDLDAIAALSTSDLWVGGYTLNGNPQTLVENFCTPPVVTNVAPPAGNAGDTVVITGSGFTRAIDVEFGATPAFSYHVDSDTQITAIAPGHKAGTVDVTVTVEGTSATSGADQFSYVSTRDSSTQQPNSVTFRSRVVPPPTLAAAMSEFARALARFITG
jgi:hypothetical protein